MNFGRHNNIKKITLDFFSGGGDSGTKSSDCGRDDTAEDAWARGELGNGTGDWVSETQMLVETDEERDEVRKTGVLESESGRGVQALGEKLIVDSATEADRGD
jgi:hypothetical protein